MLILLSLVLLCLLVGIALLVVMLRRSDGFLGLLGLGALHLSAVLGLVFAASGSEL